MESKNTKTQPCKDCGKNQRVLTYDKQCYFCMVKECRRNNKPFKKPFVPDSEGSGGRKNHG